MYVGSEEKCKSIKYDKVAGCFPRDIWHVVLWYLDEKPLRRVKTCCQIFNEIAVDRLKDLHSREIKETPLTYICNLASFSEDLSPWCKRLGKASLLQEVRWRFNCLIQHIVVDKKLFEGKVFKETEKSFLLVLCALYKPNLCDNVLPEKIQEVKQWLEETKTDVCCNYDECYFTHLEIIIELDFYLYPRDAYWDLIEELTQSTDEFVALVAAKTAIEVRDYSDEALRNYISFIQGPNRTSVDFIVKLIEGSIISRGSLLEEEQLLRLMQLMEKCLLIDSRFYRVCISFSKIPFLPASVEDRLSALANEYLKSENEQIVGQAITVKLNLEKCSEEVVCLYLPRLEALSMYEIFLALDTIVKSGTDNLSLKTRIRICQLIDRCVTTCESSLLKYALKKYGDPRLKVVAELGITW